MRMTRKKGKWKKRACERSNSSMLPNLSLGLKRVIEDIEGQGGGSERRSKQRKDEGIEGETCTLDMAEVGRQPFQSP